MSTYQRLPVTAGCSVLACCSGAKIHHNRICNPPYQLPKSANITPRTSLKHSISDGAGRDLLRHINVTSTIHQRYFDHISTIYNGRTIVKVWFINSRNDGVGCLTERCKLLRLSRLIPSRGLFPLWRICAPPQREHPPKRATGTSAATGWRSFRHDRFFVQEITFLF